MADRLILQFPQRRNGVILEVTSWSEGVGRAGFCVRTCKGRSGAQGLVDRSSEFGLVLLGFRVSLR